MESVRLHHTPHRRAGGRVKGLSAEEVLDITLEDGGGSSVSTEGRISMETISYEYGDAPRQPPPTARLRLCLLPAQQRPKAPSMPTTCGWGPSREEALKDLLSRDLPVYQAGVLRLQRAPPTGSTTCCGVDELKKAVPHLPPVRINHQRPCQPHPWPGCDAWLAGRIDVLSISLNGSTLRYVAVSRPRGGEGMRRHAGLSPRSAASTSPTVMMTIVNKDKTPERSRPAAGCEAPGGHPPGAGHTFRTEMQKRPERHKRACVRQH